MHRRLLLGTILLSTCFHPSLSAQAPDESTALAPVETPPPPPEALSDQPTSPDHIVPGQQDAITALGESRGSIRLAPDSAGDRLNLARALYRVGDLDAAIEECRIAISLQPDDAISHLDLGVFLMVKQDWRAALSVLREAIRLDPGLAHAYYSLGTVHYSMGNSKAAVQSYRQALALQPLFPDARYRLALLLQLSNRGREAAQLMEEAARGGVMQAQYFLGNAYKDGRGVDKDLGQAVFWWAKAAGYHYQPAAAALSKLRRQALLPDQPERSRHEALEGFRRYRDKLWEEFQDYGQTDEGETIGMKLLKAQRTDAAVPTLLKECYALSEVALTELGRLYESGWSPHLTPFNKGMLACFETTAAEGFLPAKRLLARIYGKGLGVPQDMQKARSLLKGFSKQEAKVLLDQLGLR